MIYTDIVEYNIVGDTKAPLLRCIPFISKLKSGDIITTGQYMNYQTFQNLQFKRLLKNAFHSIRIELRDATGEKIPFVSVGITRLVLMFRKVNDNHFRNYQHRRWSLPVVQIYPTLEDTHDKEDVVLEHWHKHLGGQPFHSSANTWSQQLNE